jgi:hypothetical protein
MGRMNPEIAFKLQTLTSCSRDGYQGLRESELSGFGLIKSPVRKTSGQKE